MVRIGRITELDVLKGLGTITDENEQEISFELKSLNDFSHGDQVYFRITKLSVGLMAVEVERFTEDIFGMIKR